VSSFFPPAAPLTLAEIAAMVGAAAPDSADSSRHFNGIGPLDAAGPADVSFLDNAQYVGQAAATEAGLVIVGQRHADKVAKTSIVLVAKEPYRAFAKVAAAA
jgi:UDP-3-O-[3-hydroxymyristoyl] glucosamine N-acyltransferase